MQWRREDEFGWAPVGTAMAMELTAELDASGRLVDYTAEIWNTAHTGARGTAVVESALPGYVDPGPQPVRLMPDGSRFSGGLLNVIPSYDIETTRTVEHVIFPPPVRTSSLRSLGGAPNTFAGESFVDELAEEAGKDPLAYRLDMVSEPRGRAVLQTLSKMCAWPKRGLPGSGRGLGLGYDRHRGRGGFVACAAEVEVDQEVRLVRIWCAADAGLIVNPDGAKNQIEGGINMAASWTLKEQVTFGGPEHRLDRRTTTRSCASARSRRSRSSCSTPATLARTASASSARASPWRPSPTPWATRWAPASATCPSPASGSPPPCWPSGLRHPR